MPDINLGLYTGFTAAIVPIVQYLKELFNLRGPFLKLMPPVVGAGLGTLCLQTDAVQMFPSLPPVAAGAVLGLLLGLMAAGSYQTVTWLQDRNAQAHATAQAQVQGEQPVPAVLVPVVASDPPPPAPVAQPTPSEPPEYAPATDADVQGQPNALLTMPAAPTLPATMAVLPD